MTDEQTMVERVGRSIALIEDEDYMEDWRRYDRLARAAIEAMREPTNAMAEVARRTLRSAPGGIMFSSFIE